MVDSYFLYCYAPLNGDEPVVMVQFEPYRFDTKDSAEHYAAILRVLKHNDFHVISESDMRLDFPDLLQDAIQIGDLE